jgi:hypothetical protein
MNHLSHDELLRALDGELGPQSNAHLASCAACRREVHDLVAVLREAEGIDMPEPGALFWQHFATRLRAEIDRQAPTSRLWGGWRWAAAAVGAGALAWLVIWTPSQRVSPVGSTVDRRPPAESVPSKGREPVLPMPQLRADADWNILVDVAAHTSWEEVQTTSWNVGPGYWEMMASELSSSEREELLDLLNEAIAEERARFPRTGKG